MPLNQKMTVGQLQRDARKRLAACGIETASLDARLIIQHALVVTHEVLVAEPDRLVTEAEIDAVTAALERRLSHEPVSRITGSREFYGREFLISPDVLDPRPDTETLVDQVIELAQNSGSLQIADLGTGSGAIIVTLMAELPSASGMATDISAAALAVARHNADIHGVAERIEFIQTSWLDGVSGPFDIIVSNPPYIESSSISSLEPEVAQYDPIGALDGGVDGLSAYRTIIPQAFECLADGGHFCCEIGAGQADAVLALMASAGFSASEHVATQRQDLSGHLRVINGQKT